MGVTIIFTILSYLVMVLLTGKSTVTGQDYFFDLEDDDSNPFYYHPRFSVEELVEMNVTPDITNDIDIDICKSSKYL